MTYSIKANLPGNGLIGTTAPSHLSVSIIKTEALIPEVKNPVSIICFEPFLLEIELHPLAHAPYNIPPVSFCYGALKIPNIKYLRINTALNSYLPNLNNSRSDSESFHV